MTQIEGPLSGPDLHHAPGVKAQSVRTSLCSFLSKFSEEGMTRRESEVKKKVMIGKAYIHLGKDIWGICSLIFKQENPVSKEKRS